MVTMTDMAYQKHREQSKDVKARCAIVTLSDTRTAKTDVSGRRISDLIGEHGDGVVDYQVIPDSPDRLRSVLNELLGREDVDAVVTNGGTGISPRDQTIYVIESTLDVVLPGFGELFRMLSWEQVGSGAMLSRAVGGVARGKLLFALPGSPAAVELAMSRLILPELGHLLNQLRK
jgi:molybdopterin adenylyltransferase